MNQIYPQPIHQQSDLFAAVETAVTLLNSGGGKRSGRLNRRTKHIRYVCKIIGCPADARQINRVLHS